MSSPLRRTLTTAIKLALAVAILSWLTAQARDGFAKLSGQSIRWPLVAAGLLCTLTASSLNFVRWHLLIRALGIRIRLPETMSLGALGLAMNFVSPGSIGGDFFKAIFLAHGQPGRRTEAIATVVADRVLGLLTMLLLATAGILATGLAIDASLSVRTLSRTILIATAVCWSVVGLLLFLPALSGTRIRNALAALPLVGNTAKRLLGAVSVYRSQRPMLLAAFGVSAVMAMFYVTALYLVGRGLPVKAPSWAEHLVIAPTAGLVGAIPITPSGLGTTELAVEELYSTMPGGAGGHKGDGTMVALARRATEIVVALIGFAYYLANYRKLSAVYAEAERAADLDV